MGGRIRQTCDPMVAAVAEKDKGEAVIRPQVQREKLHREFVAPVVLVSNTFVFLAVAAITTPCIKAHITPLKSPEMEQLSDRRHPCFNPPLFSV